METVISNRCSEVEEEAECWKKRQNAGWSTVTHIAAFLTFDHLSWMMQTEQQAEFWETGVLMGHNWNLLPHFN